MMAFIGPVFSVLKWLTGGKSPFSNYALIGLGMAIAVGGAVMWHKLDKRSAVRKAVIEYVAATELAAQKAVMDELARRSIIAKKAAADLEKQVALAQVETLMAEKELEEYAATTTVNAECVVDPDLLQRLRSK